MLNKKFIVILIFVILSINFSSISWALLSEEEHILLKSRQFIPSKGIDVNQKGKSHFLVQFEHNPNREERKIIEDSGIKLLSYIPYKAWFVSLSGITPAEVIKLPNVRFIGDILPEDKISPHLRKGDA